MKKVSDKKFWKSIPGAVLLIALFVLSSYIADAYGSEIRDFVKAGGFSGMLIYVLVTVLSVVVAPVSTLPLMPIASNAWGWFIAGALSVVGWVIGSQIAFHIARRFGKPLVLRMVSEEKLAALQGYIPQRNLFWAVVVLRMTVPVDALSYALGLFSSMRSLPYFWATLIGVTPFAFVFAYAGTLPVVFQVAVASVSVAIAVIFLSKKK